MKVRMKKLTEISIIAVLLLLIFFVPRADAQVVVDIPDENLEAAIREELGIPTGPITDTDLAWLVSLSANSRQITDLTGLEYCVNLQYVSLYWNNISDISVLSALTNLERLGLVGNPISNISALSGLTNLVWLLIGSNNISDISTLSGLTNLQYLYLADNDISDITALSGLTNLWWLHLSINNISDISALSALTSLQVLQLWNNNISDISALSGLTNLEFLYVNDNAIIDVSALSALTNLSILGLANNNISDLGALSGLTTLQRLWLEYNAISDIGVLSGLVNLWDLHLHNNNISDIQPLVDNAGLDTSDLVSLNSNPLSYEAINTDIPILLDRGVQILFDDRTPTTLVKVSGDEQTGESGSALPESFEVQVLDQNGDPYEGVPLTFSVIQGGGSLNLETTTTDADGLAEATLTLGPTPGTNTVEVAAADIATSVTFEAIAENGSNTAPVAISDSATTPMNTSVAFNVLDNDVDPDPGDVIVVVAFTQPSHGILTLDLETGYCLYLPDEDFVGSDVFAYDISDGSLSATATVTITVTAPAPPSVTLEVDAPDEAWAGLPYTIQVTVSASDSWPGGTASLGIDESRGPLRADWEGGIHDNEYWDRDADQWKQRPEAEVKVYRWDSMIGDWDWDNPIAKDYHFGDPITIELIAGETNRYLARAFHQWYWIEPWDLSKPAITIYFKILSKVTTDEILGIGIGFIPLVMKISDALNGQHQIEYTYTATCEGVWDSDSTVVNILAQKYNLIYASCLSSLNGTIATAAGLASGGLTPWSAALFITEVGFMVAAEEFYILASDPPDFNYTEIASPQVPQIPQLAEIEDRSFREAAEKALQLAATAVALRTSVERYEGAKIDEKPQYMALQLEAWRLYAQEMVELTNWLADFWGPISTSLRIPTPEEIQAIRDNLEQNGLPELEVAILSSFGYTPGQMIEIADTVASLPDEYFDSPGKIKDAIGLIVNGITEYIQYIPETPSQVALGDLDMGPETLNRKSKGKWITCYIELPKEYNVSQVSVSSLVLQNAPDAEVNPSEIGDHDNNGIPDLMVKFDRQGLIEVLGPGEHILSLTGQLSDGTPLAGIVTIRVTH